MFVRSVLMVRPVVLTVVHCPDGSHPDGGVCPKCPDGSPRGHRRLELCPPGAHLTSDGCKCLGDPESSPEKVRPVRRVLMKIQIMFTCRGVNSLLQKVGPVRRVNSLLQNGCTCLGGCAAYSRKVVPVRRVNSLLQKVVPVRRVNSLLQKVLAVLRRVNS